MNTLTKFKELKKLQVKAAKQKQLESKQKQKYHVEERREIYDSFVKMIRPFNKQTINKHRVDLKFYPKKTSVEMFIDKKLYTTFIAKTEYHSCNCSSCWDGGYGHEGSYSHSLSNYKIDKKKGKQDGPYFSWYYRRDYGIDYGKDEIEQTLFAVAMDKFITDYDTNKRYRFDEKD